MSLFFLAHPVYIYIYVYILTLEGNIFHDGTCARITNKHLIIEKSFFGTEKMHR